jgi:hypothetical protein
VHPSDAMESRQRCARSGGAEAACEAGWLQVRTLEAMETAAWCSYPRSFAFSCLRRRTFVMISALSCSPELARVTYARYNSSRTARFLQCTCRHTRARVHDSRQTLHCWARFVFAATHAHVLVQICSYQCTCTVPSSSVHDDGSHPLCTSFQDAQCHPEHTMLGVNVRNFDFQARPRNIQSCWLLHIGYTTIGVHRDSSPSSNPGHGCCRIRTRHPRPNFSAPRLKFTLNASLNPSPHKRVSWPT